MTNYDQKFSIIRSRGDLNQATLVTGETVHRQDQLFVENLSVAGRNYTGFVPCLDYRNHFIYETPLNANYKGYPAQMCTCGSMAVVAPTDSFRKDTSQPGLAFVCYMHHLAQSEETGKNINRHADGSYG